MNSTELILSITAAAAAIAADIPDNAQLSLAASAFVQLGDTLEVIAAQRELSENSANDSRQ